MLRYGCALPLMDASETGSSTSPRSSGRAAPYNILTNSTKTILIL